MCRSPVWLGYRFVLSILCEFNSMKRNQAFVSSLIAVSTIFAAVSPSLAMRPGRVLGQDAGTSVNMRSGPSTKTNVVSKTYVGNQVAVLHEAPGRDGYTWYKVSASGDKGWVRGDYIGMNRDCQMYAMLNGDGPNDVINVRSNASRGSSVVREAVHGDHVRVLRYSDSGDGYRWFNVRFHSGTEGWVRGDLVKFG
jgi:uncharacterized protein YgiM (DUF1202 family)